MAWNYQRRKTVLVQIVAAVDPLMGSEPCVVVEFEAFLHLSFDAAAVVVVDVAETTETMKSAVVAVEY